MISGRGRSVTNCDRFPGRDPLISSVPAETRVARAHFAVVVVYFGPLPKWMNLHLATCAANPDVDWVILSDHPCPPRPPNVHLFPMSLQHFRWSVPRAPGQTALAAYGNSMFLSSYSIGSFMIAAGVL